MAKNIVEDHKKFRDIISGKVREDLKKRISSGNMFRNRGKNGKISITIPKINLPFIQYGKPEEGVGRGDGKDGDVIGKDDKKGKGNKAGDEHADGIVVQVDEDYVMKLLKEELELPDLLPKESQTFEDEKIVYNGISKIGPNALLHKRKTLRETMKRMAAQGLLNNKTQISAYNQPVPLLLPNNDDRRYRQYNIIKKPSSNAVIFYMRDGSGSMTAEKCEIVSDISWWLNEYIKTYYSKTESVYLWHDTEAKEVSQETFFNLRYGGGTRCSSALRLMKKLISAKSKYDPDKWNIYAFYFGDGENEWDDNGKFCKFLKEDLGPDKVNLFGLTQVMAWDYSETLKGYVDKKLSSGELKKDKVRTTEIQAPKDSNYDYFKDETNRDDAVKNALKDLLGKGRKGSSVSFKEVK